MRKFFSLLSALTFLVQTQAQNKNDPEFPAGEFIMHVRLHNGMITNFHNYSPDIYAGGIQIVPQYTFIANTLRGGLVAGAFFADKKFQALFGPTVSLKVKTLHIKQITSGGNIHLNFDYLFGSDKQRLLGGGVNADIGNLFIIGLAAHRDYNLNNWWFQNSIAVRLTKPKKVKPIFR
jgi:hypothetical protein